MTDFRLKSILVVLAALVVTLTAAYILTEASEDVSAETTNSSDNDYPGKCGDTTTYVYDPDTETLTISGSGRMMDCNNFSQPWLGYKQSIAKVVIEKGITYIGTKSFETCYSITSVTIPDSVTEIGVMAFDSTQIKELVLPDSVTKIDDYAFARCESLTTVTLSNSLKTIGHYAFGSCKTLKSINIPDSVTSIGSDAFYHCENMLSAKISSKVTSLDSKVFSECYLLETVTMGTSVNYIGDSAFFYCKSLKTIDLSGVSKIDVKAFFNCYALESVNFGSSLSEIQTSAFANCNSLSKAIIPDSVKLIGPYAFSGCSSLAELKLPDSLPDIGEYMFRDCTSLKSVVIPDSVKNLYKFAFRGCASLTEITVGKSVAKIEYGVFDDCDALTTLRFNAVSCNDLEYGSTFSNAGKSGAGVSVIFGDQVKKIPAKLFYESKQSNATNLVSVTVSDSVSSIGDKAFYNCIYLTEIRFNAVACNDIAADSELFKNAGVSGTGISVIFGDSTTRVPANLFYTEDTECLPKITSVTVSENITTIGSYAFANCTYLTDVKFNAVACKDLAYGSTVFSNAGTAGAGIIVVFGDSVTKVPAHIFFTETSSLTPKVISVTFGKAVNSIGDRAFYRCSSLQDFTLPDSCASIGYGAFYSCSSLTSVTVPEKVTSIGKEAYANCTSVKKIVFNATTLGELSYNSNIFDRTGISGGGIEVTFGNSVTEIPDYLFYMGSSSKSPAISTVFIGESVETVGKCAFANCTFLHTVIFPDSVRTIEDYAFYNCTGLTEAGLNNGITDIGYSAFYNCGFTSLVIPDSVRNIGAYAFGSCTALTSLTIGKSVFKVGNYAFYNCTALTDLTYSASKGNNLTMGSNLFYNAGTAGKGVKAVISDSVLIIPSYLFSSDDQQYRMNLISLYFAPSTVIIGNHLLGDILFYATDGTTELEQNSKNLAGHTFIYSDGKMIMQPKRVFFTVSDGTVSDTVMTDALSKLNEAPKEDLYDENVLVLDSGKDELTVSSSALDSLKDSDSSTEFKMLSGIFEFNNDATETLASAGKDITLSITDADDSVLSVEQKLQLGDASIFSLRASAGTSAISEFDGKVTLPYKLSAGKTAADVEVYHLHEDGEFEKVDCTYDPISETVTFETDHFSLWAVTDSGLQNGDHYAILIVIVIIEIISIVCVTVCLRKHFRAN